MKDEWDFYRLHVDGEPASIFLDMGIARSAPIAGFDRVVYLRVRMQNPRLNGLSSEEEYDTLIALEEALAASVEELGGTVYVGRNTSAGYRDLFFYTRDEAHFRSSASATMADFRQYDVEVGVRDDPHWSLYFDFLYPNPEQRSRMASIAHQN
ncbi:MAG: DUF695 domain-containing protein [Phenylobacterium sp.]|uniref:DUF695 domain-containing protein n=1 Tax=Phenylobacterium sp. TaxID=1871053 RepID=UPI001A27025F|nr:DUF695 domain-containing protein [Phenylobacterium sp.]MBJ7409637.1 DUF695 domain-containing protein [Phenylobacterium sp.]